MGIVWKLTCITANASTEAKDKKPVAEEEEEEGDEEGEEDEGKEEEEEEEEEKGDEEMPRLYVFSSRTLCTLTPFFHTATPRLARQSSAPSSGRQKDKYFT